MELLFYFIFFYPLFMAYFWMMGSLIFYLRRERGRGDPPPLTDYPFVSVLVPCHNLTVRPVCQSGAWVWPPEGD